MDWMVKVQFLVGALGISLFDMTLSRMALGHIQPPTESMLEGSFPFSDDIKNVLSLLPLHTFIMW
jgi:hypothetical protein